MSVLENRFKTRLKAHESQIGLWLGLGNGYTAEICAGAGFDWLLIDGEHGPNDIHSILAQLQAIAPYGACPVVRPPFGEAYLIKQLLDIGAQTLLIPMVESAEQAEALVAAVRYPPRGIRGVGSGLARASRFNRIPNYLHEADDQICLLVQVESRPALDQIEAIAAVDGVDGVFIGPADLAGSLGHLGNPLHEEVQAAIEKGITQIFAAGKAPGLLMVDETLCRRYLSLGAVFVAVGTDVSLVVQASSSLADRYKTGSEDGKHIEKNEAPGY